MQIITDFNVMPDRYAKAAPDHARALGVPVVSFPFMLQNVPAQARYLHWAFTDPDSTPVCGFEWIHWTVANVEIAALQADHTVARSTAYTLQIPEDFTHILDHPAPAQVTLGIASQGRTSQASRFIGGTDPQTTMHYNGPQPPDKDHQYWLRVWATAETLPLDTGFWCNELTHALHVYDSDSTAQHIVLDDAQTLITGRA